MTFDPETFFRAYGPLFNMMLVFLFASIIVLIAMFAYAKRSAKKYQETERIAEAKRELLKAEKEREEARKAEETGYSERDEREDEREDEEDDDSNDEGE